MPFRRALLASVGAALALLGVHASPSGAQAGGDQPAVLPSPMAAGTTAANIALSDANRWVMLRWVAHHTGTLKILHMRIEAGGSNCRLDARPGYGLGNGGTWHVTTHPTLADGRPDMSATLSTQDFRPCDASRSVADVWSGDVSLVMDLPVTKGQEYATVVRNTDPDPIANFSSTNFLLTPGGLAGANNRNERDPSAPDSYYGLDPRELVGFTYDAGRKWYLPGTDTESGYLATYIQEFNDGWVGGQPFYHGTPATTTKTMVYPDVPEPWTIRQLGAYVHSPGSGTLKLFVDGEERASVDASGRGMIRVPISPVEVRPGQEVKVTERGLRMEGMAADSAWGNLLKMDVNPRKWYLEGEGNFTWAAPLYALPWYGADQGSPPVTPPTTTPPTTPPSTIPPTTPPVATPPPKTRPPRIRNHFQPPPPRRRHSRLLRERRMRCRARGGHLIVRHRRRHPRLPRIRCVVPKEPPRARSASSRQFR